MEEKINQFPTVAIIGVGHEGEAILRFALQGGWPRDRLIPTHYRAERRAELQRAYGRPVESDNARAVQSSDVVVVSVRPQQMVPVLDALLPALHAEQLFISVAAALDIPWLERHLPEAMGIVRAVPPPASRVRAGLTLLSANGVIAQQQARIVEQLFAPMCSRCLWMADDLIDPVSAIGPAMMLYATVMFEALVAVGIEQNVPADIARQVVGAGLLAAGQMIAGGGLDPLKPLAGIATPGGLSEAALSTLRERQVPTGIRAAALAMIERSAELRAEAPPSG